MLQGFSFFGPWIVFPYALAAIMPTWRWLLGCALLIGGGLGYFWTEYWIDTQRPDYHEGAGGALGVALFGVATMSFACGVAVRAVSLFVWARGHRNAAVWVALFGVAVPFVVVAAPGALQAWQRRAPPKACTERGLPIEIAGNRFNIPVAPMFTIYSGQSGARDSYYLFSAPHVRDLCAQTGNGTERVHATHLQIRLDYILQWKSEVCGVSPRSSRREFVPHDPPPWAVELCAAVAPNTVLTMDPTDFPLNADVFALSEVKLGNFLGSASTYEDSLKHPARGGDSTYTSTDSKTPDSNPLTFACRVQSDGSRFCATSYPWLNGVHLHYTFRTRDEQYAEKGRRIDEALRTFLGQFQAVAP